MSVAWRELLSGTEAVASGNTTSVVAHLPSDLQGGDDMFLAIQFNPVVGTPTTGLTGWTQVGADIVFAGNTTNRVKLFHKTAAGTVGSTSSEAGAAVTIGGYGTQRVAVGIGAGKASGTWDVTSVANGTDTMNPGTAPAVTVSSSPKANLLAMLFQRSSTPGTNITNSSGLTSVAAMGSGSGACSVAVGHGSTDYNNAATIPASNWTQVGGTSAGWVQLSIALGVANQPPTASAGPDQSGIEPYDTVTLTSAASSDPEGSITRVWSQIGGPAVSLSSTTATSPTFTAPALDGGTVLTFQVVVTDTDGATDSDTVVITVRSHTIFRIEAGGPTPVQINPL